jgi:Ca2+-transporting ATPase
MQSNAPGMGLDVEEIGTFRHINFFCPSPITVTYHGKIQVIQTIHNQVRGRTRFKVAGLRYSEPLKNLLEQRLSVKEDILSVSASSLTGNILVNFNSNSSYKSVAYLIENVLDEFHSGAAVIDQQILDRTPLEKKTESPKKSRPARPVTNETIKRFLAPESQKTSKPWHTLGSDAVMQLMRSDRKKGLDVETAENRLLENGLNKLQEAESRSGLQIFIDQMNSLPVYLLGAAAGVSIATGGLLDAVVIMGVVVANGIIGYFTENDAEKTIDSLKNLVKPIAEVIRDGRPLEIPAEQVVVGDLLVLKPGSYVSADCRIISSSRLSIDESMLTGESMPVYKKNTTLKNENTPLADRSNIAYMGTLVTGGQGLAVVVATGQTTEVGALQRLLTDTGTPKTPIERQLEKMGDQLVLLCGAICGVVFGIGFFRGYGYVQMLRMAITLAASAVPEGLPAAATINFALGITNMKKHGVLVRRLQAIETLGAVQTVCLDKTGTITQNRMSVVRIVAGSGRYDVADDRIVSPSSADALKNKEIRQLIITCALCNEIKINDTDDDGDQKILGSPTEQALVRLATHSGLDLQELWKQFRFIKIRHRAENRLFMSTLHALRSDGRKLFSIKGSPPDVLAMCDRQMVNGKIIPLTEADRQDIQIQNQRMAGDALRVLGFAFYHLEKDEKFDKETELIWLGLIGMTDPIRDGVPDLIKVFHRAGVKTVMITGDQSTTAYAVASELNLSEGDQLRILDSAELTSLDPVALQALAKKVHVYSRVSPAHKLKLVQALQSAGQTVAMTGDGINDGPALKASNLGIALGQSGTDVAREVADIILEEDNLEILIKALEEGRTTYGNIKKSVHFFLSTNLTEIQVMFAAMALGIGFPLNVMQLLWINIISDIFPGLALSREKPAADLMEVPPRDSDQALFTSGDFKQMLVESSIITTGSLAAYGYGLFRYGAGARAGSLAFQSLTIGQLMHAFSCRSRDRSIFDRQKLPPNPALTWSVGGSLALQVLTMIVPGMRNFLGLTSLSLFDAAVIGASAVLPFITNEARKLTKTKAIEDRE